MNLVWSMSLAADAALLFGAYAVVVHTQIKTIRMQLAQSLLGLGLVLNMLGLLLDMMRSHNPMLNMAEVTLFVVAISLCKEPA